MMDLQRKKRSSRLYAVVTAVLLAGLAGGVIWLAFSILQPTPPRSVAMAVEPEGSFNSEAAKHYREILARSGIELKLVPSTGAVESVARLNDAKSGINVAIIPSGITSEKASPQLVSLGTLYYEPLWLFSRGGLVQRHEQLRTQRLSVGPEGSAGRALSLEFLARVGIIDQRSGTLLALTPAEAAQKLQRGDIDTAILLDAWESRDVQQLLASEEVELKSIRRADAFVALYPYLNKLVLPAGVANMAENRPPEDVLLVAPKASLVVRSDLHPAIQYLLLEAALEVHSEPGMFRSAGQFPAAESIDLPLSRYARQFYKSGSPFLQRHLPFWLAVLVEQMLVVVIPLFGLLYPLSRFAPAIYGWFERRRVYKLYTELKELEDELAAVSGATGQGFSQRLDELEERASNLSVPAAFKPLLYALRLHIGMVREQNQKPSAH